MLILFKHIAERTHIMDKLIFSVKKHNPFNLNEQRLTPVSKLSGGLVTAADDKILIDAKHDIFSLGGIPHPDNNYGEYYRLDASKKDTYSEQNRELACCTPGGSVRFITNADYIYIDIDIRCAVTGMDHFCNRGVYGIDIYTGSGYDRHYAGNQMQNFTQSPTHAEDTLTLPKGTKEVMINMPLYAGVEKLTIGFPNDSMIANAPARSTGPIGFYGSSITQGGCVSRPGNSFANIICRALDADCKNFGFSGSAMGEQPVAEYIANTNLAAFVMDYDYNSPSCEHLTKTHEPFFKTIRKINPTLPVVFATHPFYSEPTEEDIERINIVKQTYKNAVNAGDKNVYFVDSRDYFSKEMRDLYAVDNLHPNDLGQMSMAEHMYKAVKKALK